MSTGSEVLRLAGVAKRFGDRTVLEAADLVIGPGERVALLGESGSGKSTLLNIAAGLEAVDAGRVELNGVALDSIDADSRAALRRRSVGFVFQAFHLLPYLDARSNVALALLLAGAPRRESVQRADEMLERVGLASRAGAQPAQLSGGEQQRVALARALVHRPALVLADEPTGNLDPETAQRTLAVMDSLLRERGASLLMVTHSEQAASVAERRVELVARRLVER